MKSPDVILKLNFLTPFIDKSFSDDFKNSWYEKRAFYSFNADYDLEDYFANKDKCKEIKENDYDIEDYFSNQEKTVDKEKGEVIPAFNQKGFLTDKELEDTKKIFKRNEGNIWYGIISFSEDVTKEKMKNKDDVKNFMNRVFNSLLDNSHLNKDNICLYATFHTNTDNHHIHFAFCEKEKIYKKRDGTLSYAKKGMIDEKAINSFLLSSLWHLNGNKENLSLKRNELIKAIKEVRNKDINKDLFSYMFDTSLKIKDKGRISYDSENMKDLKRDIDNIAKSLIENDENLKRLNQELKNEIGQRREFYRTKFNDKTAAYIQDNKFNKDEKLDFEFDDKTVDKVTKYKLEISQEKIKQLEMDIDKRIKNTVIKKLLSLKKNSYKEKLQKEEKNNKTKRTAKEYIFIEEKSQKEALDEIKKTVNEIKLEIKNLLNSNLKNIKRNFSIENEIARYEIELEEKMKNEFILKNLDENQK